MSKTSQPRCFSLEVPKNPRIRKFLAERKGVRLAPSFKRHAWRPDGSCRRCEKDNQHKGSRRDRP